MPLVLALVEEEFPNNKFLPQLRLQRTGHITFTEFRALAVAMAANPPAELPKADSVDGKWYQFVAGGAIEFVVDFVLVIGLILSVRKFALFDDKMEWVEWLDPFSDTGLFAVIFLVEAAIKLYTVGFDVYTSSLLHRYDMLCTALATTTVMCHAHWLHVMLLVRSFRISRMLKQLKLVELTWSAASAIAPRALSLTSLLLMLLFVFSWIGNCIFGGMINKDSSLPDYHRLKASAYGESDFYDNNFNDFPSAFVLLFELLIVNNWYVLSSGFEAVTRSYWSELFFVVFWWCGVVIVLNVVLSAVLDAFLNQINQRNASDTVRPPENHTIAELADLVFQKHSTDYGTMSTERVLDPGHQAWVDAISELVLRESATLCTPRLEVEVGF